MLWQHFMRWVNILLKDIKVFCKDPKSDRAQAARTAAEAVGAKLVSYTGLRGPMIF